MKPAILLLLLTAALSAQPVLSEIDSIYPTGAGAPLNTKVLFHLTCCDGFSARVSLLNPFGTPVNSRTDRTHSGRGEWILITPAQPLVALNQYSVRVDIPGRLPIVRTFSTGTTNDTSRPVIVSTSPAPGEDAAFRLPGASIRFSKPMSPFSFNNASPLLVNLEFPNSGSQTVWQLTDPFTLTANTYEPLPLGKVYSLSYPGNLPQDLAGNALDGPLPSHIFTTFPKAPKDGPKLAASIPIAGETEVPTNTALYLKFDRPAPLPEAAVFTLSSESDPGVALRIELLQSSGAFILRPQNLLRANEEYTLRAASFYDSYGGQLPAGELLKFRTGRLPDIRDRRQLSSPQSPSPNVSRLQWRFSRAALPFELPRLMRFVESGAPPAPPIETYLTGDGSILEAEIPGPGRYFLFGPVIDRVEFRNFSLSGSPIEVGSRRDDQPPAATLIFPNNPGAVAAASVIPSVEFDEPLRLFDASQVSLFRGDERIPFNLEQPSTQIRLVPRQPLPAGDYRVEVLAPTDLAGNVAAGLNWTFRVGPPPSEPFQLLGVEPPADQRDVDPSTPVVFRFNRPPNPVQALIAGRIAVSYGSLTGGGKWKFEDNLAIFEPNGAFPPGARVAWSAFGLADYSGIGLQTGTGGSFWVAKSGPEPGFRVTEVYPPPGEPGMPGDLAITLKLSQPAAAATIAPENIALLSDGKPSTPRIQYNAALRTVTITPEPTGGTFTVIAGAGVLSQSGTPLETFSATVQLRPLPNSSFPPADPSERPFIRSSRPANSFELAGNDPIILFFHEPLDRQLAESALSFVEGGALIPGRIDWTPDRRALTFYPATPRSPGKAVLVALSHVPFGGKSVESFTISVANVPPRVESATWSLYGISFLLPTDGLIEVRFDQDRPAGYVRSALAKSSATFWPDVPLEIAAVSPRLFRFRSSRPFLPDGAWQIILQTADGELRGPGIRSAKFATPASRQITVGPTDPMGEVPLDAIVWMKSQTPLNALRLQVKLTLNGNTVPAKLDLTDWGYLVLLRPAALLQGGATYKVEVTGLEDTAGRPLPDRTWTFHTGSGPDYEIPKLVASFPRGTVSPASILQVTFSKPVHFVRTGADEFNYGPADFITGTPTAVVTGSVTFSTDGRTLTYKPDRPWPTGSSIEMYINPTNYRGWNETPLDRSFSPDRLIPGFLISSTATTAPPRITSVNPAPGTEGAPLNVQIQTRFAEPVTVESLSRIRIESDGESIPVRPILDFDGRTVTIAPLSGLAGSRWYRVIVEGVQNASGVAMAADESWVFQTANSVAGAATRGTLVPRYGDPFSVSLQSVRTLNPLSLETARLEWICANTRLAMKLQLEPNLKIVNVTPAVPPPADSSCSLTADGFRDWAGNSVSFFGSFTIAASSPDANPPTAQFIHPPPGGTIEWYEPLAIVFDEPYFLLNGLDGIRLRSGGIDVPFRVEFGRNANTLSFLPRTNWNPGDSYEVEVNGIADAFGNEAGPLAWTFQVTNNLTFDSASPRVVSSTPSANAVGVPPETPIVFEFSKPVLPVANIQPASLRADAAGGFLDLQHLVRPVYEGRRVKITDGPLPPGASVSTNVTLSSFNGSSNGFFLSFSTAATPDSTPPVLESVKPAPGSILPPGRVTFNLRFSEPVRATGNVAQFSAGGRTFQSNGTYYPAQGDGRSIQLNFDLPPGADGTLEVVPGATDLSGNTSAPAAFAYTISSDEGLNIVQVVSAKPLHQNGGVPVDAPIEITFNQPVAGASIEAAARVWNNGNIVPVSFTLIDAGKTWRLTPPTPWLAGSRVRLELAPTLYALSGALMHNPYVLDFVTADAPSATLTSALTAVEATGSWVDLRFEHPIATPPAEPFGIRLGQRRIASRIERMGRAWFRITPDEPVEPKLTYHLMAGSGAEFPFRFTAPATPPLAAHAGSETAARLDSDGMVRIYLDSGIHAFLIDESTLALCDETGHPIPHTARIATDGRSIEVEYYGPATPSRVVLLGNPIAVQRAAAHIP